MTRWINLDGDNKPAGQPLKSRCCSHDGGLVSGLESVLEHVGSESCQTGPRAGSASVGRVEQAGQFSSNAERKGTTFLWLSLSLAEKLEGESLTKCAISRSGISFVFFNMVVEPFLHRRPKMNKEQIQQQFF